MSQKSTCRLLFLLLADNEEQLINLSFNSPVSHLWVTQSLATWHAGAVFIEAMHMMSQHALIYTVSSVESGHLCVQPQSHKNTIGPDSWMHRLHRMTDSDLVQLNMELITQTWSHRMGICCCVVKCTNAFNKKSMFLGAWNIQPGNLKNLIPFQMSVSMDNWYSGCKEHYQIPRLLIYADYCLFYSWFCSFHLLSVAGFFAIHSCWLGGWIPVGMCCHSISSIICD